MAGDDAKQRAAAVCDNCGTAHAARLGPDGEIRPIGTGQGAACTCGDGKLHIVSDDTAVLEDVDMGESEP